MSKHPIARTCAALAFAMATLTPAWAETRGGITLEEANAVITAALAAAKTKSAPGGTIAVVDAGGNLVALQRLDRTFAASASVSTGKARTAALFQKPTKALEEIINGGRTTMVALPDFTPLQGGIPLMTQGQLIGAVGVSGAASAAQDEEIAEAAASAAARF